MINADDPYQFSMNESISNSTRTRSSSRNRKQNNNKKNKDQQMINTRSSQKSPLTPKNDQSFMSNIQSGFSQFVNPKKRQREEKKTKTNKRSKSGRTNLVQAAATNAQILANRNAWKSNTTYTINIIDDTQVDTLAIPDTLVTNLSTQHNDSSWQRDIDRLMKKLEEPPLTANNKSQIQIQETQFEEEENIGPIQTAKIPSQQTNKINTQSTTTIKQKENIAIQTDSSQNHSSTHDCCQDVSNCPCVLKYSKLERLFMEKMSRLISIVPTIPNENHQSMTVRETSDEIFSFIFFQSKFRNEIENQTKEHEERIPLQTNENSSQNNKEKNVQKIDDISAIEKMDTTAIIDHSSILLISKNQNSCSYSSGRPLVLTTSSLNENQKVSSFISNEKTRSISFISRAFQYLRKKFNPTFVNQSSLVKSWLTPELFDEHSNLEWYTSCLLRPRAFLFHLD